MSPPHQSLAITSLICFYDFDYLDTLWVRSYSILSFVLVLRDVVALDIFSSFNDCLILYCICIPHLIFSIYLLMDIWVLSLLFLINYTKLLPTSSTKSVFNQKICATNSFVTGQPYSWFLYFTQVYLLPSSALLLLLPKIWRTAVTK